MYIVLTVTLRGGNFTDSEKSEYNQDASKVEYFSKYNIHPTTCYTISLSQLLVKELYNWQIFW